MENLIYFGIGLLTGATFIVIWVNHMDNRQWWQEFKNKHKIK